MKPEMQVEPPAGSPEKRAAIALLITVLLAAAIAVMFGARAYLWIKAIHVIAVISWMAGMLYLPRLFVYHCDAEPGSQQSETFKIMEQRLLGVIMNPAMVIAWSLGLWLAWVGGHFSEPWLHAKIALVIGLSATHGYFSGAVRAFREDRNTKSARHWRMLNEVPALLMVGSVVLVIVKPI